jgi:hypothetical protein
MSVAIEFKTVDILLASDAETRGVDAFVLSLIKAEKQARRLVTYLVYQHPWCSRTTVPALKRQLAKSSKVYFEGVLKGWDALYPRPIRQLVGSHYPRLRTRLSTAAKHRNKIFHGQLTAHALSGVELVDFVTDIREWCDELGAAAQLEVQYDGCGRNSFRKASNAAALYATYKTPLTTLAEFGQFIKVHMERKQNRAH